MYRNIYTVLILEDNLIQLGALADIVEQSFEQVHILKASDYDSAEALLKENLVQFFLLDVELETGNPNARTGIDFGRTIRNIPKYRFAPVLYITSIPDRIQTAVIELHCQNYILKPYTAEEIQEAIHFLLQTPFVEPEPLKICDHSGVYYKIREKDILFIEASGKEMTIYVAEKQGISKITTCKYRLTEFKSMLSGHFMQCHKKYLVNTEHISSYDKVTSSIHIADFFLSVGRKYKAQFDKEYH